MIVGHVLAILWVPEYNLPLGGRSVCSPKLYAAQWRFFLGALATFFCCSRLWSSSKRLLILSNSFHHSLNHFWGMGYTSHSLANVCSIAQHLSLNEGNLCQYFYISMILQTNVRLMRFWLYQTYWSHKREQLLLARQTPLKTHFLISRWSHVLL